MSLSDAAIGRLRDVVELPDSGDSRYEIIERIGEGGMGAVYLARDRELGREVALKVLRAPEPTADERARLLREARILAVLEHPGIVPVHDVGTLADGRVFYVMKRVRGERLDAFARAPRPLPELLRVFLQVCDAVGFAHAAGVIHRDLKPQNVMIGPFGEVLVLDWGVAKGSAGMVAGGELPDSTRSRRAGREAETRPDESADRSAAAPANAAVVTDTRSVETAPGTVLGTPGYMAPEQLAGERSAVDPRTDVYGLGGTLYFMLTGEHPAAGPIDDPRWRRVPAALRSICARARAADPSHRYPTASELAADIARYLDGLPVSAHRETVVARARRIAYKYRTPILLVLAYLVMRVLLLLAFPG
jgi:serine/threonine-protein kinase